MAPQVFTFDFEGTLEYATGLAYSFPGEEPVYLAWNHWSNNNATFEQARAVFERAIASGLPWLAHNGKFDSGILLSQFGIDLVKLGIELHDTMFLMFLADPHALSYNLKDQAKRLIGYPTDDKDDMAAWVWANATKGDGNQYWLDGRRVNRKQKRDEHGRVLASNEMEFVQQMPGDLVGRYAIGDIKRTIGLFRVLWGYVIDDGNMLEPYQREQQLMPIFAENERDGIRVEMEGLERDLELYQRAFAFSEEVIRERLGAPDLNICADQDYAHALIRAGQVREDQFARTEKKGEFRVGKNHLTPDMFADPQLASVVGYRNRLLTALRNFMEPWAAQGRIKGHVSTNWNQTRGGDGGTRTGRPSTNEPNFLNISKNFEGRPDGYVHPEFLGLPKLPLVRKYLMADEGGVWAHRDFSGQEMRVFAHYESGELLKQFLLNPELDPHEFIAKDLARVTGKEEWMNSTYRTFVKNINFGKLYGAGVPRIMEVMSYTKAEATALSKMHDEALPGRALLNKVLTAMAKRGAPIKTWGGRVYFAEEPRYHNGKLLTWEYKLLNYLVQGSAADLTKQAIIEWYHHPDRDRSSRFLVTVYDEINISARKDLLVPQMALLKDVMNKDRLDCPMRSDAKIGPTWGDAVKIKDKDIVNL